jgi:hypothetical protein
MQDRPEQTSFDNPLRHLTPAQFMALGGNAVVYVRSIKGKMLTEMMPEPGFEGEDLDEDFHIVVSADGSPLLVADSAEAVDDWLSDKNFGIVALH